MALSTARCKDDHPVAKIENHLISNFSMQTLLYNICLPIAKFEIGPFLRYLHLH